MTLEDDIKKLKGITRVGFSLVDFIRSIHPGEFQLEGNYWVYRPDNFVTIDVHWKRANNITLSLRGAPTEFVTHAGSPLTYGMGNVYSRCKIERADQLDAASYYIRRALELYQRGRSRPIRRPRTIES